MWHKPSHGDDVPHIILQPFSTGLHCRVHMRLFCRSSSSASRASLASISAMDGCSLDAISPRLAPALLGSPGVSRLPCFLCIRLRERRRSFARRCTRFSCRKSSSGLIFLTISSSVSDSSDSLSEEDDASLSSPSSSSSSAARLPA